MLAARQEAVNRCCFGYPKLLKNEIEYLHQKIHEFPDEPDNDLLVNTRYEREFKTGLGYNAYQ